MINNRRVVCFIQAHYTDIIAGNLCEDLYSIGKIKESGIFDNIVIGCADVPENKILVEACKKWGVDIYMGSIDNIVDRMRGIIKMTNADVLVRILLNWFFIDLSLVYNMVNYMVENDVEYVCLPYDFDIKFAGEVCSSSLIEKLYYLLERDNNLKEKYKFRPWFIIESNPYNMWTLAMYTNTPEYDNVYFEEVRSEIKSRFPIAWNFGEGFYYHGYKYAERFISTSDVVLDVACGWGAGTAILAKRSLLSIGIDLEENYIRYARLKYKLGNLKYIISDAMNIPLLSNSVDFVISMHTIEHLRNDILFLEEISRILKREGFLFIEAPVRLAKPFVNNSEPLMSGHIIEYEAEEFLDKIRRYFRIIESYGVNRGCYCELARARNAVAAMCRRL